MPRRGLKAQIAHRIGPVNVVSEPESALSAMKLLPRALASTRPLGIERVARFAIVREGIAQHQGRIFRELMIELARGFGFRARDGKEIGGDLAGRQARESARRQERIDSGCDRGIDVRAVLAAITAPVRSAT